MGYTPPPYNSVDSELSTGYTSPAYNSITAEMDSSGTTTISHRVSLDLPYSINADNSHRVSLDLPYSINTELRTVVDMIYSINTELRTVVDMIYSVRMGADLVMYYGDCPALRQQLSMPYGDSRTLRKSLDMRYGDMLQLRSTLDMPYHINKSLRAVFDYHYIIADHINRVVLDLPYTINDKNHLRTVLDAVYMIEGDPLVGGLTTWVKIEGVEVGWHHLNVEGSLGDRFISAEIHFVDKTLYDSVQRGQSFECQVGTDNFIMIVDAKRKSNAGGAEQVYIVTAGSPAARLTAPWTRPITRTFAAAQASDIVLEMADGITVDYQIPDYPIAADALYANEEDRASIIRKIIEEPAGGIMQSDPDGTLRICHEYAVDTNKWQSAPPDYYLTENINFISQDDTPQFNAGFNKYEVGSQMASDKREWTEQREITGMIKEVLGFQVPWDSSKKYALDHSGGEWVALPEYLGVVEEMYPPPTMAAEKITFKGGFANASRPIYGNLEINWRRAVLGAVTTGEDGKLEAELKTGSTDGYSLAEIRYLTRYHLWRVRDVVDETVQFLMREVE